MLSTAENRRELRTLCRGDVYLFMDDVEFHGQMLDVSHNGFRAQHMHPELAPGREVRFEHRFFVGRARVVWTHEMAGKAQSGFQVVRA